MQTTLNFGINKHQWSAAVAVREAAKRLRIRLANRRALGAAVMKGMR